MSLLLASGTKLDYCVTLTQCRTTIPLWVFAGEGLWGMGYDRLMGYGMQIPASNSVDPVMGYPRYGLRGVQL